MARHRGGQVYRLSSLTYVLTLLCSLPSNAQTQEANVRPQVLRSISQLKDLNPQVRAEAAVTLKDTPLSDQEVKAAIPLLIDALKDTDHKVRRRASAAIGSISDYNREMKIDFEPIIHALSEALTAAQEGLTKAQNDDDVYIWKNAAFAIASHGKETEVAVSTLSSSLKDKDADIRQMAVEMLSKIGPEARHATPELIEILREPVSDRSSIMKTYALIALGNGGSGSRAAVPDLIETLKKGEPIVRWRAAEALGKIGPDADVAVPALIQALTNKDPDSPRRSAALALGSVGPGAKRAIPSLVEALNDKDQDVRQNAASSLRDISVTLYSVRATDSLDQLRAAYTAILKSPYPEVNKYADSVKQTIDLFDFLWFEQFKATLNAHRLLTSLISVYPLLLLIWLSLLWLRPLWLFQINQALAQLPDLKLPDKLGGFKVSPRFLILVGLFHYHTRVLDAWVAGHMASAREEFERLETVRSRSVHVNIPVVLEGRNLSTIAAENLRTIFLGKRACLLIWGEGGSGKTSLACQILRWAMASESAERLCPHLMLPILIDQDFPQDADNNRNSLVEAVRGGLQVLLDQPKSVSPELTGHLLSSKRILVLVDHFSEMGDDSREVIHPGQVNFPAAALIITSRLREELDGVPKTALSPLRIEGNRLSSFMEAYLTQRGKREEFDDLEFFEACQRLSLLVGERAITVLLAKFYADRMIAAKDDPSSKPPEHIPDLMTGYLHEANRGFTRDGLDDAIVLGAAKSIAWECLKNSFRPTTAKTEDALAALGGADQARPILNYLEQKLSVIQRTRSVEGYVRFVLDPLAEYFAAMQVVEFNAGDEKLWREFLARADNFSDNSQSTRGFLLAVRDCCLSSIGRNKVPDFVPNELAQRGGLDSDAVKKVQMEERVKRLVFNLSVPESDDRYNASIALGKMGPDAKAAVPTLTKALKDTEGRVRAAAARALGRVGAQARSSAASVVELLKDPDPAVRASAAGALHGIETESKDAVPALVSLLNDSDARVRMATITALTNFGQDAKTTVPYIIEALEDTDKNVRNSAQAALLIFNPKPEQIVPPLIEVLKSGSKPAQDSAEVLLAMIGEPALPDLTKLLIQVDSALREKSLNALWLMGSNAHAAVSEIVKIIEDEKAGFTLRSTAISVIEKIGPDAEAAVPALLRILTSNEIYLRTRAAEALGSIGSSASSALPELMKASEEQAPPSPQAWGLGSLLNIGDHQKQSLEELQRAATGAIRRIRGEPDPSVPRFRILPRLKDN